MSNEIALRDSFVNNLANLREQLGASSGGVQYLKFAKGDWVLGRDEQTFRNNEFYCIVNIPGISVGWQCWKDGTIADSLWIKAASGGRLPPKATLPDHGPYTQNNDGWSQAAKMQLLIIPENGVKEPIQAEFTTSSVGGRGAVDRFLQAYTEALMAGEHTIAEVPVVRAKVGSYKHKQYGKVEHPVFEIHRWVTPAEARVLGAATVPMAQAGAVPLADAIDHDDL